MAVEPEVKLTGLIALIAKSGEMEAVNVNVTVALCPILPEVPMTVTT